MSEKSALRYKNSRTSIYLSNQLFVNQVKLERGCADCGYNESAVALDFDHVRDEKSFYIGGGRGLCRPRSALLVEIAKCDVVCANCHRVRTWNRKSTEQRVAN